MGTEYDVAQSRMAFSHLEFTDWSALVFVDFSNVRQVNFDSKSDVAPPPFLSGLYVVWPILEIVTASRQTQHCFGDDDWVRGPIRGTDGPISAAKSLEPDTASTDPTSAFLPLSSPFMFLPLPSLRQASMTGPSFRTLTIKPAPAYFSFRASALTPVFSGSTPPGPYSPVAHVSVGLGAAASSGACVAPAGQSSTFLLSTSPKPEIFVINIGQWFIES